VAIAAFLHQSKNECTKGHGYRSLRIRGSGSDQGSLHSAVCPLVIMDRGSINRFCSDRDETDFFKQNRERSFVL
jgi:hypothetical protein